MTVETQALEWPVKKWQPWAEIETQSFVRWTQQMLPMISQMKSMKSGTPHKDYREHGLPVGKNHLLVLREFPLETMSGSGMFGLAMRRKVRATLQTMYGGREGAVCFTEMTPIPLLVEAKDPSKLWMSLTPMEYWSGNGGVRRGHGRVLVGGLGMGLLVRRLFTEKKTVKHVTVVDVDQGILDFFGRPLVEEFGSDRVELVHGDIYEQPIEGMDSILVDIWTQSGGREWDRKFEKLRERFPKVWGWGGFI